MESKHGKKHLENKPAQQLIVQTLDREVSFWFKNKNRLYVVVFLFFYLCLLRHARSPTMPGTPVSPLRSTATVMNYANPLVFVQSTMTQGCKQLTPGIKKANLSPFVKKG